MSTYGDAQETKLPTTSWLLMRCAGVTKGAEKPGREEVGQVSVRQLYEIAKVKQQDPNMAHVPLLGICRMLKGTARTCGIRVVKHLPEEIEYDASLETP